MFKIDDKDYELKLNIKRCEIIENALGKSLVAALAVTNNCQMSVTDIRKIFSYSLKEPGADAFVPPKQAMELCDKYMEEYGYMSAINLIIQQVSNDMGFLFRQS